MKWEFDGPASTTFPLYSRAVVGDLCPDPMTPLTASLGVGAELGPAWARVYADVGLRPDPYPAPETEPGPSGHAVGMFGANLYLNTSLLRLFGGVAGADPGGFIRQYLGERPGLPRQQPEDTVLEADPEQLRGWAAAVVDEPPDRLESDRLTQRVGQLRGGRHDLASRSGPELAARITAARGELRWGLRLHARAELATALVTELLTRTCDDAGHPSAPGAVLAGQGGTGTGEPVASVWRLGRQVHTSQRLHRLLDQGVAHAAGQLDRAGNNEVGRLRAAMTPLLAEYGHHGPGGWELAAPTWSSDPGLLLSLLDALRRCPDEHEPAARARAHAERAAVRVDEVRAALRPHPATLTRFDDTRRAAGRWLRERRRLVDLVSAAHHEQRLAALELGRRAVERGLLDEVAQVFMLLASELEQFAAAPEDLAESLRLRSYDYHALTTYQPPFVTVGQPPPAVRWPRSGGRPALTRRGLAGSPAAPGFATGPARVARPAGWDSAPRPGDVLVLRSGGPAWLPLLPLASAVVMDDGGALSEVAVACRDLGIPCVTGCVDATERLENGREVVVDGAQGTVLPESVRDTGAATPSVAPVDASHGDTGPAESGPAPQPLRVAGEGR